MRIISGRLRGKRLHVLKGLTTRPTSDRVREAIFNILSNEIFGACILDLYAGTGALSIEALSRGANSSVLVDSAPSAISIIRKNIESSQLQSSTEVIKWNILRNLSCLIRHPTLFDLVFMDPPYNNAFLTPTLTNLSQIKILKNQAIVIIEHHPREHLENNFLNYKLIDQRRYGKTLVSFLRYMV